MYQKCLIKQAYLLSFLYRTFLYLFLKVLFLGWLTDICFSHYSFLIVGLILVREQCKLIVFQIPVNSLGDIIASLRFQAI
jgi:hypothetical protein